MACPNLGRNIISQKLCIAINTFVEKYIIKNELWEDKNLTYRKMYDTIKVQKTVRKRGGCYVGSELYKFT